MADDEKREETTKKELTPLERMTALARRVVAVGKAELQAATKDRAKPRKRRRIE